MQKEYKEKIHSIRDTEQYLRERRSPRLYDHSYPTLIGIRREVIKFRNMIKRKEYRILDMGCGCKPYQSFFLEADEYIGADIVAGPYVDVVCQNHELHFPDNSFDYLICTQSLEHTQQFLGAVQEMYRVVKPGGLLFVSVPFLYPEHAAPYDFRRFTRFGLKELFKDFEIISIRGSTGYFSTMFFFFNVLFSYGGSFRGIFAPLFLISNILGASGDLIVRGIGKIIGKHIIENQYNQFTNDYCVILKKGIT